MARGLPKGDGSRAMAPPDTSDTTVMHFPINSLAYVSVSVRRAKGVFEIVG